MKMTIVKKMVIKLIILIDALIVIMLVVTVMIVIILSDYIDNDGDMIITMMMRIKNDNTESNDTDEDF